MRDLHRSAVTAFALGLFLLLPMAGETFASGRDASGDEAAVIKVIHDACKAYLEADTKRMAEVVAEDFTLTDADGVVTTRADDIEMRKRERSATRSSRTTT